MKTALSSTAVADSAQAATQGIEAAPQHPGPPSDASRPKQQLDNVRRRAKELEVETQKAADKAGAEPEK